MIRSTVAASLLLMTSLASADTFTLDFSDVSLLDSSSTGVWNASGARLQARPGVTAGSLQALDFGTGADGAFVDGASASGLTISGSTITFDTGTSTQRVYQFTRFTLSSGKQILVTGNFPLVIKVLGDVTIAGAIVLDGESGGPNTGAGPIAGGVGKAGGGSGGNGGGTAAGDDSTDGSDPGNDAFGGDKGADSVANNNYSGGGGGCSGLDGSNDASEGLLLGGPSALPGACTTARSTLAQAFTLATLRGGGAGGGGGAFDPALNPVAGGSGGAGGGALAIQAIGAIQLTGSISAKGGVGGANNTVSPGNPTDCGGAGGGGAGGTVWLQSGSSISGGGTIDVTGGAGGDSTDVNCAGLHTGGSGSAGIIRVDSPGASATITPTPAAVRHGFAVSVPAGSSTILSRAIDLTSSRHMESTIPEISRGCGTDGTLDVVFEGSDDGVTYSAPVSAAEFNGLKDYGYVRFRVNITATGTNPPCLTGLSFTRPADLSEIELRGGLFCGTLNSSGTHGSRSDGSLPPPGAVADFAILGLALLLALRLKGRSASAASS